MLAFGLGTLPNLMAAGWLLARFRARFRQPRVKLVAGLLVAGFGIAGLLRVPNLASQVREGLLCITG
jgi:sulfite exporter TauE/SafE